MQNLKPIPKSIKIFIALVLSYSVLISPINTLSNWQKIKQKGYLSWITRISPFTIYNSIDGEIGLEYDILKSFTDSNKLKLKIIKAKSNHDLFSLFIKSKIEVAGANLTLTSTRKKNFNYSTAYDETYVQLVSSKRKAKIAKQEDLSLFRGAVIANSSYSEIAKKLLKDTPLSIKLVKDKTVYEILDQILHDEVDYTFVDNNLISLFTNFVPKLRIGMRLSEMNDLGFLLQKNEDNSLKSQLDKFINTYKKNGKVEAYKIKISQIIPNSKEADTVQFLKNYVKRWSLVKPLIYKVAKELSFDPILLGAISYQESHWNAKAVSPTLVKGLMMLTKDVAKEQNVSDRLDPLQSLRGGTVHLLKMLDKVPKRITNPDKLYFALAAYNLGYGNFEKARVITQKNGANPDLWKDVKRFLPLLNELEVAKADGKTAVRYVENILIYRKLLQWKEQL